MAITTYNLDNNTRNLFLLIQKEIPVIIKRGEAEETQNGVTTNWKYIKFKHLMISVRPVLHKYQFYTLHWKEYLDDKEFLFTRIEHVSGFYVETSRKLHPFTDPKKQAAQTTYLKRYNICDLLDIVSDDDDESNLTVTNENKSKIEKIIDGEKKC